MGTTATPTPITFDQAVTNAKTSEGAYLSAQQAKSGTASALAQATQADADAGAAVTSLGTQYLSDLEVLRNTILSVESGLPTPAPATPAPGAEAPAESAAPEPAAE